MRLSRPIAVVAFSLGSAGMPAFAAAPTDDGAPPAVVAQFEVGVAPAAGQAPRRQAWLFWREPTRVETRTADGGELWWRDARGSVFYQRLFHGQRRIVEYTPADLRALGTATDWARLTHLVDPKSFGVELKRVGATTVLGRPAMRYRGRVQGVGHDVLWLTHERIPARMRIQYDDRTVTIRLKAVHPIERSPWPRANTAAYAITDYADVGDDEADPFLRGMLNEAGLAHAH